MRKKRHLSNWLKTFMTVYGNSEAPEKFVYWTGLATIGAALQRNVCFNQVKFRLYPHLYLILVGPPAVKKTTSIHYGVDRLRKVNGIHIGQSSVTWQFLVDEMLKIQTVSAEEMARTGQAVRDSCPIVLPAGELGTLIDFEERASIDFFVTAWDSPDTFEKGTRLMGVQSINGPCPSILAATTPQWIKDNVKGGHRGGGFISRCIMPYADRPSRIIAYPADHLEENHYDLVSYLEHDLALINAIRGEYTLTPEAKAYGTEWYKAQSDDMTRKAVKADSDNWAHRKYVHIHKIIMSLTAAYTDDLVVTLDTMKEAIKRIDELHDDFNRVFALLDDRKETRCVQDIESFIQDSGSILEADLVNRFRVRYTRREITESISLLLTGKIITKEEKAVTQQGAVGVATVLTYRGAR